MRNEKGQFVKGHPSYNKGKGWKNEERICKCGKVFNPRKKTSKSCSQHCAMVGAKRRLGKKMTEDMRKKIKHTWFKKGQPSWCLGTKGIVKGFWEGKHRVGMSGENHPNWKGGITTVNEKIRKSLEYKMWRKEVFKRDNYSCVICGKKFIKGVTGNVRLHADHIKEFSRYLDLRFDINNGRTLCVQCHIKTPNYGYKTK
jgi:hypothetical protein